MSTSRRTSSASAGPHRGLVLPGDRDQRLGREGGAQHRGVGDQPPHRRVQGVEAGGQQRVQAVRHRQLPDVADQPVDALDRLDDVAVDQRPHGLHREQRDALRLGGDRARAAAGIPGTSASTSWSIDAASSGSRVSVVRLRPVPNPGRAWPSSGRANTST